MSASNRTPKLEGTQGTELLERIWENKPGWLVHVEEGGKLLVDFEGNAVGPLVARSTVELTSEELRTAITTRRPLELRFEDGNPRLPVVVGIAPVVTLGELLRDFTSPREEEPGEDAGLRVIQGQDELVLQCGKASITLRRNGKIIIKGTYVETHSEGVNRIKGGSVQIN